MLDEYEHELGLVELELDGAIELRSDQVGAVAAGGALLAVAVVLTALNLRPAVTGVGPLLPEMRASLGASNLWAGVLVALPVWCFAGVGLIAPRLSRRVGLGWATTVALIALTAGLLARVVAGPSVVIGGTLVATAGIALVNVLIPVVIKRCFPARLGLMTGMYTAALAGGGALGSAITPAMADTLGGWRPALGGWAGFAVLALASWSAVTRGFGPAAAGASPGMHTRAGRSLLRSRLAWLVTLFFGGQSFLAFVVLTWLPEVFIDNGVSKANAGLLVGLTSLIGVPFSIFVCPLAAGQANQSRWIVALGLLGIGGIVGLMVAPAAAPLLWSVLVGLGISVFSLALTVIALRTRSDDDTARLSGMAQGFGYLLAGFGPFAFGLLHNATGEWTGPWIMVLVVCTMQVVAGALAGRNRYV